MKKTVTHDVGGRIKKLRVNLRMSRRELASKCGFKAAILAHYETNFRRPPPEKLKILAENLKTSTDWLNFGIEALQFTNVNPIISRPILQAGKLPVLKWRDLYLIDGGIMALNKIEEFEPVFEEFTPGCFCIDVEGDAMVSAIPFTRSFLSGTRLYINPKISPLSGDYVIAKIISQNTATFRQYVVDSGVEYLKPLNPQYPTIRKTDDIVIIGVALKAVENLR